MPASAGGHCRGHCRRDIVGAKDKVSDRGIAECSSGLYPELHSGIPPGRLLDN
ncbi:unnamed protein product [Staurois parvus]|uniref:Uncharacterized protein n=1 Tax=Staurois parvus TaxID=386267 RepID=A0ABN9HCE1_9NEOB|nr:unnamed protein product [Staurois parvus]